MAEVEEGTSAVSTARGAWHRLTRPSYALRNPAERWRAEFYASLLLVLLPVGAVGAFVRDAIAADEASLLWNRALTFAVWAVSYGLTRTVHFRWGIRVALFGAAGSLITAGAVVHDMWFFAPASLVVVGGGLLVGLRDALVLLTAATVGVAASILGGYVPLERSDVSAFVLFELVVLAVLLVGVAFQRRSEAERRLQIETSESRYRGLFELAFDGIVVVKGGAIVDSNRGFLRITGRTLDDLVGHRIDEVLEQTGPAKGRRAFLSTETAVREARGIRSDGQTFYVELVSRPQEFAGGVAEFIAVRDISERKQAELQLSIAHRAVSLGTLAAGVAHEINNPLAWVGTNLTLAAESSAQALGSAWRLKAPGLALALDDAEKGVERVADIVRDLGVLSRDSAAVETTDLEATLDLVCRIAAKEVETRATLEIDYADLPLVKGNSSRLGQVFLNLLTNAAHAIPDDAEDGLVRISVRNEDEHVVVEVHDNGPGIPPEVLPHVFDPFFTTKANSSGTGLGLPISRTIIDGIGGKLEVRSSGEAGTTFTVVLPRAEPEERDEVPAPPTTHSAASTRRARVLVIDDEPLVGASLTRALKMHDVEYCDEAESALDLALSREFDVILCDLMMPGMTGQEFYAALPDDLAERIVFMTGGAFSPKARAFIENVSTPVLAKPFSADELRTLVATRLAALEPAEPRKRAANEPG